MIKEIEFTFLKRIKMVNELVKEIYDNNKAVGWWTEVQETMLERSQSQGNRYSSDVATLIASKLALVHSEVSEALEGMRKGLMDDHLPERPMVEVELADAVIRIMDLAGFLRLDLGGAIIEKLAYNAERADHKLSNRAASGGKTI